MALFDNDDRDPYQTHLDPLGLLWDKEDDEEPRPYMSPYRPAAMRRATDATLMAQMRKLTEGQRLTGALQTGGDEWFQKILGRLQGEATRRGLMTGARSPALPGSEWDTSGFQDFSGDFGNTDANLAIQGILDRYRRGAHESTRDFDARMNSVREKLMEQVNTLRTDRQVEKNQAFYESDLKPAMSRADELMARATGTAGAPAEWEANLRSRFAGQNRAMAATNLSRVGAALGLRGVSDSPAAAALASSVAEDYDRQLMGGLADLSLQTEQMNQQDAMQDSFATMQLASAKTGIYDAMTRGDTGSLIEANRTMQALIDTLYSRNKTFDLQRQAIDAGVGGASPAGGALTGAVSGASAGAAAGPWGMAVGGALGAAGGYLNAR